jgi:hypothetical protein
MEKLLLHQKYNSGLLKLINFNDNHQIIYNKNIIEQLINLTKLTENLTFPVYIISFIGEARFGKSTLINCIITYLTNNNTVIFLTQSSYKHCTIGIDICIIKLKEQDFGYLFMDCQGLNHQNSSNDSKIMLLPYEISNIIIYNEMKINNSTIKGLEPMTLFEKFIANIDKKQNKPKLIIRVRDYTLDEDISDILLDTLIEHDDQYSCLKKSIKNLFSDITAIKSNQLTMQHIKDLKSYNYLNILNDEETGFRSLCTSIIDTIHTTQLKYITPTFIENFLTIIEQINSNSKIDHKLLDLYSIVFEKEIKEFIDTNLNNPLLKTIHTCSVQDVCYKLITSKIQYIENIIVNFTKTFEKSDYTILQSYQKQLIDIKTKLSEDLQTCISLTNTEIQNIITSIFSKKKILNLINKFFITNHFVVQELEQELEQELNQELNQELEQELDQDNNSQSSNLEPESQSDKSAESEYNIHNIKEIIQHIKNNIEYIYYTKTINMIEYIKNDKFLIIDKILTNIATLYQEHILQFTASFENRKTIYLKLLSELLSPSKITNIDITLKYDKQKFIKNIYDAWIKLWNDDIDAGYDFFTITFTDNNIVKHNFDIEFELSGWNSDTFYINIIETFVNSDAIKKQYNILLNDEIQKYIITNNITEIKDLYNIIILYPEITFYIINVELFRPYNLFKTDILINTNIDTFIEQYIKPIDERINKTILLSLYAQHDVYLYKKTKINNIVNIDFKQNNKNKNENVIVQLYFINKIMKYYNEQTFEKFLLQF